MFIDKLYPLNWEEKNVFTPDRDLSLHVCKFNLSECSLVSLVVSDLHTLVELVNFSAVGKMQPFSVDISTNCLLLMVGVNP